MLNLVKLILLMFNELHPDDQRTFKYCNLLRDFKSKH